VGSSGVGLRITSIPVCRCSCRRSFFGGPTAGAFDAGLDGRTRVARLGQRLQDLVHGQRRRILRVRPLDLAAPGTPRGRAACRAGRCACRHSPVRAPGMAPRNGPPG
jgi:hypothetical protein